VAAMLFEQRLVHNYRPVSLTGKRVEVKRAIPQDRMLVTSDDSVPSEPIPMRIPFQGRGMGAHGAAPFSGRLPSHPWGKAPFDDAPVKESSDGSSCGALSAANSVLGPGNAEVSHQAFNFPGGNFSSATRSLNQGIRTTYGAGSEPREVVLGEGSTYKTETRFAGQHGQQQQLLHQLQEEQLKLQIAQQVFNVQQVKQLQEMQQLVAAQHAIVAHHSRSMDPNTYAAKGMSLAGTMGSFPLCDYPFDAQLANLSCANSSQSQSNIGARALRTHSFVL